MNEADGSGGGESSAEEHHSTRYHESFANGQKESEGGEFADSTLDLLPFVLGLGIGIAEALIVWTGRHFVVGVLGRRQRGRDGCYQRAEVRSEAAQHALISSHRPAKRLELTGVL